MMQIKNRVRLMEEHLRILSPDVIGLSEIDCLSGSFRNAGLDVLNMMKSLGYDYVYEEKRNGVSASGVFYQRKIFRLIESKRVDFGS